MRLLSVRKEHLKHKDNNRTETKKELGEMQSKEMTKMPEDALFDNKLAQEFISAKNPQSYASYLKAAEMRLCSGMTAEEIDAVTKRARDAFKNLSS